MSGLHTSWESFLPFCLYSLYYFYLACAAERNARNCADGAVMGAHQQLKQENCRPVPPGEGVITHHYGPAHIVVRICRHGNISTALVSRDPALHAALLLTQLGLQQICTPQSHPAQHHLPTLQTAPRRIYRMNGPREECGCCINFEDCDCSCNNLEICDCSCPHEMEEIQDQDSSPPPPPQPSPTPGPSQPRFRPPKPQPDGSRSPRRPRTRSRSRSPTPLVRTGRRYSREYSREGSVTEAARHVVNRVFRQAEHDRRALEEKWENQSRLLIAKFEIGHKQGVVAAQRLHNSYVLPQNLYNTFIAGFLACLVGVLTGLIIIWSVTGYF